MSSPRAKYVFVHDIYLVLDERHLTIGDLADGIGVSRQHLGSLLAGHRAVTVRMRQKILAHPKLAGLPERRLWKVALSGNVDGTAATFELDEIGRLLDAYGVPGTVNADASPLARVRWLVDELRARERHVAALESMLSPEALAFVATMEAEVGDAAKPLPV